MATRNANLKSNGAKPAADTAERSVASRDKVYEIAAEVFHSKGYDKTSMSDIASAVGLTKAGLYHHVASKEQLLATVLDYGMDMTEAYVVKPLESVADPILRLKTMIELHLRLILEGRKLAVTGLLHECQGLSPAAEKRINRRKKKYVHLVSDIIREVLDATADGGQNGTGRPFHRPPVDPKMAALALLGMLNWTYQWYKPTGTAKPDEVIREFQTLFLNGVLGAGDL